MLKAYPRHSVDISKNEYRRMLSLLFLSRIIDGEYIGKFESLFAQYEDLRYAISIPSARLGLYLIFKYYNLPSGSEIIITPFTHQSIFTVIKTFGLKPVFVDIDPDTHNTTPNSVIERITKDTKLLILTHMWGQPCDMDGFMELKKKYGIKIIEDCAMACGATYRNRKVGTFGDAAIFSFGKAKAISTFDGGMLCTNDSQMHEQVRRFVQDFRQRRSSELMMKTANSAIANFLTRPHVFFFTLYPVLRFLNIQDPYNPLEHKQDSLDVLSEIPAGWKYNFSNLQAAVGIEQLKSLDERNEKRIENARVLNQELNKIDGVKTLSVIPGAKNIYLYYPVSIRKNRIDINDIRRRLIKFGVDSQLNELTSPEQLKTFGAESKDYPVFKEVSSNLLIIPNGIYITRKDAGYVGRSFQKAVESPA